MKVAIGLALALGSATLAGAQAKHVISPSELMRLTRVQDAQISPDGAQVAYVRTATTGKCERDSQIWLVPSDGSAPAHPFILGGSSNGSPEWAPDGKAIAFLSDRELPPLEGQFQFRVAGTHPERSVAAEGATATGVMPSCRGGRPEQIWLIARNGGDARPLTAIAGGVSSFRWSPDGSRIAFIRYDLPSAARKAAIKAGNDETVENEHYLFGRLWVYDLHSQQARLVTKEPGSVDGISWSPDGKHIVARISPTTLYNDHWYVSKIAIVDVATGAEKTMEPHTGFDDPQWSPDGSKLLYSMRQPNGTAGLPAIQEVASGTRIEPGASYRATMGTMHWQPDSQGVVAAAIKNTSSIFVTINATTGAITPMGSAAGPGEDGEFSLSKDGSKIAFVRSTPSDPGDICVLAGGEERVLTDANPQVKDWRLPTTRPLSWKSSLDGTEIYGLVLLPPGYQVGRKYPTVAWIHGGPEEAYVQDFHGSWYDWLVMLASHGYVVLLPNPRGSDGQGVAFTDANYQKWGEGDYQDIMDGVTLLEKEGIADPARLGVGGWSYGGYMTSWTITHTDRFKTAIMGAAITDLVSSATTSDIAPSYWADYWGATVGNSELLFKHSPVHYVENCHTPVLVVVGGSDMRLTSSQSYEFYHGLRDLGRKAEMVVYPREHHIFIELPHQINSLTRMLAWYKSYLGQ